MEIKNLTRPVVDEVLDGGALLMCDLAEVHALGQEFAHQAVGVLVGAALPRRKPKQSCHNCETKVVTPPLTTMADRPEPSNDAGFQGLRSKGVTWQLVLRQRSKVVTAILTG